MDNIQKDDTKSITPRQKYIKKAYKMLSIRLKPDDIDMIKSKAADMDLSIAQLVYRAVKAYEGEENIK